MNYSPDFSRPLVTIGLPVFNGAKYLGRAIKSLLNQSFDDFNIIISDNASADNTWNIIQYYASQDKRISSYRQSENLGSFKNFQFVLDKARGPYFMWAAADDWWAPEFIHHMVIKLQNNSKSAVAMCAVERVTEKGEHVDFISHRGPANPENMNHVKLALRLTAGYLYHVYIYGLYRTDFLSRAFRNIPRVMGGDRLFACQIALATQFSYVDQILHIRTVSSLSLAERYAQEELGRIWSDPYGQLKTIWAAGPYLIKSRLIPLNRKIWIPLIIMNLIIHIIKNNLLCGYYGCKNLLYLYLKSIIGKF